MTKRLKEKKQYITLRGTEREKKNEGDKKTENEKNNTDFLTIARRGDRRRILFHFFPQQEWLEQVDKE
jgi:hypothetical protein